MILPYKIATLLYCFNERDEVLLLERAQQPNLGLWSPPGGKLHTEDGESPYACACREAMEELSLQITPRDLHLTGLVSEHGFQGNAHWLMFLFEVKPRLTKLPATHREGRFEFFAREALSNLKLPDTDRESIWPWFWQHRGGFFAAHCHCHPDGRNEWRLEQSVVRRQEVRVLTDYQRENALRERINKFLRDAFNLPEGDYYAKLDVRKLLNMKAALSDINNALTIRLTLGFLKWVQTTLTLDAATASKLRSDVLNAKPSSNGFDVKCDGPVPFIAEVKCNIPVNGGAKYGSAQRAGILKDVAALRQGKLKAGGVLPQSLKFMVFLDLPEVRRANEHLIPPNSTAMRFLTSGEVPSDPTVVYGVYVSLGD